MKKSINKAIQILVIFSLVLYSCGKNISTIEKIDITNRIVLEEINSKKKMKIDLIQISAMHVVPDSVIYKSHELEGLSLDLVIVNKNSFDVKLNFYDPITKTPNFKWIIENEKLNDSIYFFYEKIDSLNLFLKPNEKRKITLSSSDFLFEDIFGYKSNYTDDIMSLLLNFKLEYYDKGDVNPVCQGLNTRIVIYNRKSKWIWGNVPNWWLWRWFFTRIP